MADLLTDEATMLHFDDRTPGPVEDGTDIADDGSPTPADEDTHDRSGTAERRIPLIVHHGDSSTPIAAAAPLLPPRGNERPHELLARLTAAAWRRVP